MIICRCEGEEKWVGRGKRRRKDSHSHTLLPNTLPPQSGRPFLGICLGLQILFDGSDENGGVPGLGLIPGRVTRFPAARGHPVPHIGWNEAVPTRGTDLLSRLGGRRVYYVHSFRATPDASNAEWVAATSDYGAPFVAAVARGGVCGTQFHPEKSGAAGLDVLRGFLEGPGVASPSPTSTHPLLPRPRPPRHRLPGRALQ